MLWAVYVDLGAIFESLELVLRVPGLFIFPALGVLFWLGLVWNEF